MSNILAPGGWSIRSIIRTLIIGWILMTVLTYLAGTSYRGIMIFGAVAGWLGTIGYGYVLLQRSARRPGPLPPLDLIPEAPPPPGAARAQRTFRPKSAKLTQDEVEQARHNLHRVILGREHAIKAIMDRLKHNTSNSSRTLPTGVFLLIAQPGMGMSNFIRHMAAFLSRPLCIINLVDGDETEAALSNLDTLVKGGELPLVVFEEVERLKAKEDLLSRVLLAVTGEGKWTTSDKEKFPSAGMIFVFTTTEKAADLWSRVRKITDPKTRSTALKDAFLDVPEGHEVIPKKLMVRIEVAEHLGVPDEKALGGMIMEEIIREAHKRRLTLTQNFLPHIMNAAYVERLEDDLRRGERLDQVIDGVRGWCESLFNDAPSFKVVQIEGTTPEDARIVAGRAA